MGGVDKHWIVSRDAFDCRLQLLALKSPLNLFHITLLYNSCYTANNSLGPLLCARVLTCSSKSRNIHKTGKLLGGYWKYIVITQWAMMQIRFGVVPRFLCVVTLFTTYLCKGEFIALQLILSHSLPMANLEQEDSVQKPNLWPVYIGKFLIEWTIVLLVFSSTEENSFSWNRFF